MNCFYNTSMTLPLLIVLLCSLCLCSVNSQDATHNVTGPDFLVTDGTRKLTLTCQAETSPGNQLVWFTPGTESDRCETGTSKDVCTFTPRLEDDNQTVTCSVLAPGPVIVSSAVYQVNLKYPPQSSPNISIEPRQTEPLKQGDNITCTVSGGKPRVSSVIIYCQYPDHKDQEDIVGDDDITVTSSIMVNTSQSTDVNTTCTCYANWPPEPALYRNRTTMNLQLQYKAKVTNFTINGTTELTLNETSHSTVIFACQGDGRPPPVLRLYKQGDDTALIQAEINADTQQLVYTIDNVRGEDLATYTCEADNGFQDLSTRTVLLWVNFSLPQDDDSILTVAIVVAVVGVLLVIGIIVVIVICLRRRKLKAGHKGHHDSQNRNQNNGTTVPVTMTATTVAQVSLPDSNLTDTNDKINDGPISAGGYITVIDVGKKGQRSTDSKEYANVDELTKNGNKQGSNNAASTLRNDVQTPGYENVSLDPIDAPKVMTTAEKPDIVASIPEDSAEETNRPESEAYAVVAPKPKGDNQHNIIA